MYYASVGLLSLILSTIINFDVLRTNQRGNAPKKKFRYKHFLIAITVYYLSDALWGILYEQGWIAAVFTDTVIYFAAMALSVLLWTRYVVTYLDRKNAFSAAIGYAGQLILLFMTVVLVLNFFTPIVFGFNDAGEYVPGSARYVILALQIALFLSVSVYTIASALKESGGKRAHYTMVGCSGIVMTLFIILQTCFPLMPFYAAGCLIATALIHAFVIEDERRDYTRELGSARKMAHTDALTGVRNTLAYAEAKGGVARGIAEGTQTAFCVAVFDIDGLKDINDSRGHRAGDAYIKSACAAICRVFRHSPVFRIGGDEFAAILEGEDYENRTRLFEIFDHLMADRAKKGMAVLSHGMSEYLPGTDLSFDAVFERADRKMYEQKKEWKGNRKV